jgi:hypothetical protein
MFSKYCTFCFKPFANVQLVVLKDFKTVFETFIMSKVKRSGENKEHLTENPISFDGIFPEDLSPQSRACVNQVQEQSPTKRSAYANNVYSIEVDDNNGCRGHNTQVCIVFILISENQSFNSKIYRQMKEKSFNLYVILVQ